MAEVILVMRKLGNIRVMRQALAQLDISCIGVSSEQQLYEVINASSATPALVDVSGFGASVWRMCSALQEQGNPFIVLSAPQDMETGSRSLRYGATSVLQKPVTKSALLHLVCELVGLGDN